MKLHLGCCCVGIRPLPLILLNYIEIFSSSVFLMTEGSALISPQSQVFLFIFVHLCEITGVIYLSFVFSLRDRLAALTNVLQWVVVTAFHHLLERREKEFLLFLLLWCCQVGVSVSLKTSTSA